MFCKTWYCYKCGRDTRVFVCVHWQSSDHADQHKHLPPEDGERTPGYKKDAEIKRGKNPTRSKDRKTEEAGRLHVGRNGAFFFSPFHQHFYFLFGGTDVVDYSLLLQRRFVLVLLVFIVFKGVGARRCRFIEHSKTDNIETQWVVGTNRERHMWQKETWMMQGVSEGFLRLLRWCWHLSTVVRLWLRSGKQDQTTQVTSLHAICGTNQWVFLSLFFSFFF